MLREWMKKREVGAHNGKLQGNFQCICVYPESSWTNEHGVQPVFYLTDKKMISYWMLFLFICTATRSTPSIKAVILFRFSAQGDDRVRAEKRDSAQFEFVTAINTVTEFYCHTQEKGVFVSLCVLLFFSVSYSLFPEDTHILTFRPKDKCFNYCLFLNVLPVTYGDGSVLCLCVL